LPLPPPRLVPRDAAPAAVPVVQRAADTTATSSTGSAAGDAPAVPVPTTTVTATAAPPPPAPPPADAGPTTEELAGRLFEPLLRRLRSELLGERGRHGRVTDLRR
jgi:hypothetical protein